jgi:hypothetical protein
MERIKMTMIYPKEFSSALIIDSNGNVYSGSHDSYRLLSSDYNITGGISINKKLMPQLTDMLDYSQD